MIRFVSSSVVKASRRSSSVASSSWDGAPSGPNYLLFVDAYRLADALWDRSKVGWSAKPHAAVLGVSWIEKLADLYYSSAHC